jgi:hypothetical protein
VLFKRWGVAGIFQTVSGLKPNTTYTLTVMAKSIDGKYIYFGAKNFNGTNVSGRTNLTTYQKIKVVFTTGAGDAGTKAQIYASSGLALYDDFSLVEGNN